MCNYKGMKLSRKQLLEVLDIERKLREEELNERQYSLLNGFDYKMVDIIVPQPDCKWDIIEMEWGFIPEHWWTRKHVERNRKGYVDEKTGRFIKGMTTLNAKGEELLLPGKMYRDAALNRRCLFPATDFYEWMHIFPIGKKGQPLKTPNKFPYRIGVKGEEVFFVAGIWQQWVDRNTVETVDTCASVTTAANSLMEQIHNSKKRMPTMLTPELAQEWISDGLSEQRITEIATFQIPSSKLEAHPIKKDFITALDPNEPFVYEGLPELVEK